MKLKFLLITAIVFTSIFSLTAQNPLKIGHVNIQELVQKHPTMDSIKATLDKETKDLQEIYTEMLAEHEKKLTAFETASAGYSDFVKQTKQTELIELSQKIQNYNQSAQQQLQQRNMELIRPVYDNVNQEISNIAGYGKFTYILDVSNGAVAYMDPESEDITPKVLAKIQKK